MKQWERRQAWLLPVLTAAVTSGLGVAINLATDPQQNFQSWVIVGILTVFLALVTGAGELRRAEASNNITTTSAQGEVSAPVEDKLVLRRTEHIRVDGAKTTTHDIYNKDVAIEVLAEDLANKGNDDPPQT